MNKSKTASQPDTSPVLSAKQAGFRTHAGRKPRLPYLVDHAVYKRFDAKNAIFSRSVWDKEFADKIAKVRKLYQDHEPGYSHVDSALVSGALFCGVLNGTLSPMMGPHQGLLSFENQTMDAPHGPVYHNVWDANSHTPEEIASIVKKAARFYGASLVGIAPFDERWIYSGYFDMMKASAAPIEIQEAEKVELPPGQLSPEDACKLVIGEFKKMEAGEFKALLVNVMETADPSVLPATMPAVGLVKALPASMVKEKLSTLTTLPTGMLRLFAKRLGMEFDIASVDPGAYARPHYQEDGTLIIPSTMKSVIVLAFEMDHESVKASPTMLGDAATMDGYSKMAITAGALAKFLMSLGYNAIPCGNNTGLSVPMAIDAGLGELGRQGILITPQYGPRVRLAKVITDLPMAYDEPIRFGVKEFCDVCGKCAKACPVQAISHGPQDDKAINLSTNPGVMKWPINAEKCYMSWEIHGSGCTICIKVCPFNKPAGWIHDVARILVRGKSGLLDQLLIRMDDAMGYGSSEPSFGFWNKHP
jgi:reductive dehalogenase